jgi:hypothetical protein
MPGPRVSCAAPNADDRSKAHSAGDADTRGHKKDAGLSLRKSGLYRAVRRSVWQVTTSDHVGITERQARACADLLNQMAHDPDATQVTVVIDG